MTDKHLHVSDEILLLYASEQASEELSAAKYAEVRTHLAGCASCSARLEEINRTLTEFTKSYRQALDPALPPAAESRAALRSRLAELSTASQPQKSYLGKSGLGKSWSAWVGSAITPSRGGYALASLVLVLVSMLAIYRREIRSGSEQLSASLVLWTEPKTDLTPGATLPISITQVCAASSDRPVPAVPVSLQRKVLAMYGISGTAPDAYEVDYLITPELGGATDIRNLWPEPYYDTAWNAHVKDQLEERLHEMVCHGDVDLATAQQDISRDWIAAYRKYFHTDRPIADHASLHQL
jgi:hypothetical protein